MNIKFDIYFQNNVEWTLIFASNASNKFSKISLYRIREFKTQFVYIKIILDFIGTCLNY